MIKSIWRFCVLAALLGMTVVSLGYAQNPPATTFSPASNGFAFENNFTNDFIPAVDAHTSGLCGGMAYATLDYYFAGVPVPTQPFRPANGTPLHNFLYNRQVDSLVSNIDKWGEVSFNPFGARNSEFFNWGISAKRGERIDELKSFLDAGRPCVLGLKGDGATPDHQVVAFSYVMGAYRGDLGPHLEDFKVYVYDPNYPGQTRTLIADRGNKLFRYAEGGTETWRTYFVDRKYQAKSPPAGAVGYPSDGLVHELALAFATGADDLRGGNDNVDVAVNFTDGTQQTFRNVNASARWIANNTETAELVLSPAASWQNIRGLVVSTTFGGGLSGDNWDMASLTIGTLGGGFYSANQATVGFKRFTGSDKSLSIVLNDIPVLAGQANRLLYTFRTGGDNLRGGNDNVNATIVFSNGQTQRVENLNNSAEWHDQTTTSVAIDLNRAAAPSEIVRIDLDTTFGGGIGGDNWNMDCVAVRAVGNGLDQFIARSGFKRFTGDDRSLSVPVSSAPIVPDCPPTPPPAPPSPPPRTRPEGLDRPDRGPRG
jgi:hypothetical protein